MLHRKSRFDAAFSRHCPCVFLVRLAADSTVHPVAIPPPRMKLHSSVTTGLLAITAYDAGYIAVNGRPLTKSFLLTPQRLVEDWPPGSPDRLTEADLQAVADLNCPIVLLGTGSRQRFPAPALLRPLIDRRVGVEVMDTYAACRTYNILMAEGRDVAAALIIECVG
jgi:uncharacterized protein